MKRTMKHSSMTGMLILLIILSFTSCEKNATEPGRNNPPPLPPAQSMQMNLSLFDSSPNNMLAKSVLSKDHFFAAFWRVFLINTTVRVAAIAPTAIFVAAVHQQPQLKADGKFHWIYTVTHNNETFIADLAGWIDTPASEIVWEMYVSSTTHKPVLDKFLWYEGRATIENKEGWWLFYDDKAPDSRTKVLKIDWKAPDPKFNELVLSNIKQGSTEYGDTLTYVKDNEENFLIFYDASETKINTIYWNTATSAGFIEWFDYKEGARSYWDEQQNDIPAPPL